MVILTYILVFLALSSISYLVMETVGKLLFETLARKQNAKTLGLSKFIKPERLLQLRLLAAIILFTLVVLVLFFYGVFTWWIVLPAGIGAAILAYWAPLLYYQRKQRKRLTEMEAGLLDFCIALTNGLKSGMALGQSIAAVTRRSKGVIKEEFQQVLREQKLGLDITEALERLLERVPCEDLRLLITTVKLTMRTGGSLVDVLSELIDTIRARRQFTDKLNSMTAQGRFEALAISLSPLAGALLLGAINRNLMLPLVTTGLGWASIGVIIALITVGYLIINKIISIEV